MVIKMEIEKNVEIVDKRVDSYIYPGTKMVDFRDINIIIIGIYIWEKVKKVKVLISIDVKVEEKKVRNWN